MVDKVEHSDEDRDEDQEDDRNSTTFIVDKLKKYV